MAHNGCKSSSQDIRLKVLSLRVKKIQEITSENFVFDKNPSIIYKKNKAIVTILSEEFCDLVEDDFSPYMRITPDTVFLLADYNWAGGIRIGTMDECLFEFTFVLSNYTPDAPLLKVSID